MLNTQAPLKKGILFKDKTAPQTVVPTVAKGEKPRIELLDAFRFLAIIIVVFYHYFYSKTHMTDLYPYGKKFNSFPVFQHGKMGVQLFYMISGFVIFMTIEKCKTLKEFLIRRFIRLWPLLVLCAPITFIGVHLMDPGVKFPGLTRGALGFLPSLTFIDPFIWSSVFGEQIEYIDNVYWSLLVEVKFYLVFGALYFFNKDRILLSWFLFTAFVTGLHVLNKLTHNSVVHTAVDLDKNLNLGRCLIYFTAGIIAYQLYCKRKIPVPLAAAFVLLAVVQCKYFLSLPHLMIFGGFIGLFTLFIYKPRYLSFMNLRLFALIGLVSYPLYLLHNFLGSLIIYKVSGLLNLEGVAALPVVAGVIVFFIAASYFADKYYDSILQKKLKRALIKAK